MSVSKDDLPKCLQRYSHLIDSVSDERADGDGYWVYLVNGMWIPDDEVHCVHEDSPRACIAALKTATKCTARNCCTH